MNRYFCRESIHNPNNLRAFTHNNINRNMERNKKKIIELFDEDKFNEILKQEREKFAHILAVSQVPNPEDALQVEKEEKKKIRHFRSSLPTKVRVVARVKRLLRQKSRKSLHIISQAQRAMSRDNASISRTTVTKQDEDQSEDEESIIPSRQRTSSGYFTLYTPSSDTLSDLQSFE